MKLNTVWPEEAVVVWLVLIVGKFAQVTPAPVALKYCPFDPVVPSWTPILLEKVVTPAIETLSKFVWPSTSSSTKSPLPTKVVALIVVPVVTPEILTLSKFVCPSTSMSWKVAVPPILPEKVVTPAILTLSKFVWPSTSKSAFKSIAPAKVVTPAMET